MSTVLEVLNATTAYFKKYNVPDARLDAQYILACGLKMKRMDLYLNFDRPLTKEELDFLRPLVARRAKREPLQHIIGNTSFRGCEICCDKRALIPRPETEMIIDLVQEFVSIKEGDVIADIGTGSGALAIAFAKEIPNAQVLASDVSPDALALAKSNAIKNEVEGSILFFEGDLLSAIPLEWKPNILIANLPYIPIGEQALLQEEVRLFDPPLALFGGEDGLALIRKLLKQTEGRLAPGALLLLEIAPGQEDLLKKETPLYPWLSYEKAHLDFMENIRFVEYRYQP